MLSKYRSLALCAFFVIPALLLSACGGDVPGNSVAVVGDQTIKRSTFNHWMQVAAVSQAGQANPSGAAPKAKMVEAIHAVLKTSLKYKTDLRTAAYIEAIDRVATVTRMRGMYA